MSIVLPSFENPYVEKSVKLNADEHAVLIRELREDVSQTAYLLKQFQESPDSLSQELVYLLLSLKESRMATVAKLAQVELDGAQQREERFAALREANRQIHELENQIGQGVPVEQTKGQLRQAEERLRSWWETHGMGYLSELTFNSNGVVVGKFSCYPTGAYLGLRSMSDTPVSDAQAHAEWVKSLETRGLQLVRDGRGSEIRLADTDKNKALLTDLITSAMPSARVTSTVNHIPSGKLPGHLTALQFRVLDLADVMALPAPVPEPVQA